jgi:hypothetical protein
VCAFSESEWELLGSVSSANLTPWYSIRSQVQSLRLPAFTLQSEAVVDWANHCAECYFLIFKPSDEAIRLGDEPEYVLGHYPKEAGTAAWLELIHSAIRSEADMHDSKSVISIRTLLIGTSQYGELERLKSKADVMARILKEEPLSSIMAKLPYKLAMMALVIHEQLSTDGAGASILVEKPAAQTNQERIRRQRLEFCIPRREIGQPWSKISADYRGAYTATGSNLLFDGKANADTLRLTCTHYGLERQLARN